MRDKIRALYYPDYWVNDRTLIKSSIPAFLTRFISWTGHRSPLMGSTSSLVWLRPLGNTNSFSGYSGVPVFVHQPHSGPVTDETREAVEADLSDINFVLSFQEVSPTSQHFRDLHIAPGAYSTTGETHETVFQRFND